MSDLEDCLAARSRPSEGPTAKHNMKLVISYMSLQAINCTATHNWTHNNWKVVIKVIQYRPYPRCTRTVQSYLTGGANVNPIWNTWVGICTIPVRPSDESLWVYRLSHMSGPGPFLPSKLPSRVKRFRPHLTHGSFGPPKSTTKRHLNWFSHFWQGSWLLQTNRHTNRLTDHATICSNRLRLASTVMQPKNTKNYNYADAKCPDKTKWRKRYDENRNLNLNQHLPLRTTHITT